MRQFVKVRSSALSIRALLMVFFLACVTLSVASTAGEIRALGFTDTSAGSIQLASELAVNPSVITGASYVTVPPAGTPNAVMTTPLAGFPSKGTSYTLLTTGDANLATDPRQTRSLGADDGGGNFHGDSAFDVTILKVDLNVPEDTNCFGLDFRFLSAEYPAGHDSPFNDAFIAELDRSTWTSTGSRITAPDNFAVDQKGQQISINTARDIGLTAKEAAGTFYRVATPLLTAAKPVTPGTHSLYLSIFDQGDRLYDSAVMLDNLRFGVVANVAADCKPGVIQFENTPSPSPDPTPSPGGCPLPAYPKPSCTGVPPGTVLKDLPLTEPGAYRATTPGEVIDGKHIAGSLVIYANNVTIKNSQIDGRVLNNPDNVFHPFTITDSTVGPENGCITSPGIGDAEYSATRVYIRGHDDGFRFAGDNLTIRDSFAKLCFNPPSGAPGDDGSHSDGIQDFPGGANLIFDHNTIDAGPKANRSIYITSPNTRDVTITNNLTSGGSEVMEVIGRQGATVVRGNRIVANSWGFYPTDTSGTCSHIDWADNYIVTIDANYNVTSIVSPQSCVN